MEDVTEIVCEVTVTCSEQAVEIFRQKNVNISQFLESNLSASCTLDKVGSTYRLTGSFEGIKHIRMILKEKLEEMLAADEPQQLHADSLHNITDNDRQKLTCKLHDDVGAHDVKRPPSPSRERQQDDVIDKQSQSTESTEELLQKPKRIRKLKCQSSEDDNSTEAIAQSTGLAERRVDDGGEFDEEAKERFTNGNYVNIEVDEDRHRYLMTYFGDELRKALPSCDSFEDGGKHKVALAVDSKKRGVTEEQVVAKYNSLLDYFQFEIVKVPYGVDESVFFSLLATTENIKNVSLVLDEDNKRYKLIGSNDTVDKMKKIIDKQVGLMMANEQLQSSKEPEGNWTKPKARKKGGNKMASNLSFSMEYGKLNRCESSESLATKKCELHVTLFEWRTKASSTEAIVCAIDGKMHDFKDARSAIPLDRSKKYKEECSKILNQHHNSIPGGTVLNTPATGDVLQKMKVKHIVHIVLEEKVPAKSTADMCTVMKDIIYKCLRYADETLQAKSISFPHLGGSDYCDIHSFVRGSIEALQSFTSEKPHHLQRVSFVARDTNGLRELEREFELCVDCH